MSWSAILLGVNPSLVWMLSTPFDGFGYTSKLDELAVSLAAVIMSFTWIVIVNSPFIRGGCRVLWS